MERWLLEYLLNALWQIPILTAAAALLLRLSRADVRMRHRLWLATLLAAVLIPMPRPSAERHIPAPTESVKAPVSLAVAPESAEWITALKVAEVSLPQGDGNSVPAEQPVLMNRIERQYTRLRDEIAALREPHLGERAMRRINALFLVMVGLGLLRLGHGVWAAKRLVRLAERLEPGDAFLTRFEDCAKRMRVAVPELRVSRETRTPAVVGMRKPTLLLPEDWALYTEAELRAVLLHELAHLQRRDYGVNLLCHIAQLPVLWHPAVHVVQRQIRRTRELVCDRMAAECEGVLPYTRSLLRLAEMVGRAPAFGVGALGMGSASAMRERVTELLEEKTAMKTGMKVFRTTAGVAVLTAAFMVALSVHVKPALAGAMQPVQQTPGAPEGSGPSAESVATPQPAPAPEQPAARPTPARSASPAPVPSPSPQAVTEQSVPADAAPAAIAPAAPAAPVAASAPDMVLAIPAADASTVHAFAVGPDEVPLVVHAGEGRYEHHWKGADGREISIRNNEQAEPSPEEKRKIETQIADARKKMEAAQKQMADAMKQMQNGKWQEQMADASRKLAEAESEMQRARFSSDFKLQALQPLSPEIRKQMADAQAQIAHVNSEDFKRQMADLQRQMARMRVDLPNNFVLEMQGANLDPEMKRKALQSAIANLKAEQDRLQKELDSVGNPPPDAKK